MLGSTTDGLVVGRCRSTHSSYGCFASLYGDDALAVGRIIGHTTIFASYGSELRSKLAVDNGIIVLTIGGNDNGVIAALVFAHSVLKAIEAQLRACTCHLIGLAGFHSEFISGICLFLNSDAIKRRKSRAVLQNIESLIGVQHNGYSHFTLFGGLQDIGCTRITVSLTIHAIAGSVGWVVVQMRICYWILVVSFTGKAESQRDVVNRCDLCSSSKITSACLKCKLSLRLSTKCHAGESHKCKDFFHVFVS